MLKISPWFWAGIGVVTLIVALYVGITWLLPPKTGVGKNDSKKTPPPPASKINTAP